MATDLSLDRLLMEVGSEGGSCLTSVTELEPVAGQHASIAPAKYASQSRNDRAGTYAYETRIADGEAADAVIVDSKQSQLNRVEASLVRAIEDGHSVLSRLPRAKISYTHGDETVALTELELPHRIFDAHIRAGSVDGTPVPRLDRYRAARDADQRDASALFGLSPTSIVFGSWDSTRKQRQGRWRSLLVGEIVGFCVDRDPSRKGGARLDPLGQQIQLSDSALKDFAARQGDELTRKTYDELSKKGAKASTALLGGIAPSLEALAGVACSRIVRSHVLSFAALRQIRFGKGAEGDAACRALLAALALSGLARSDAELALRANCDLAESSDPVVTLHGRGGHTDPLASLRIAAVDQLLADALAHAENQAGVDWSGVTLNVTGDPAIGAGAEADGDE